MADLLDHARDAIARCRALAMYSEEPGVTTRTFLSPPMRLVHSELRDWMLKAGMTVAIDAAGNLRGSYAAAAADAPALWIGSHLDTVPNAGAFDGILGVVLGAKLVELLGGRRLRFGIEVVGFSEEEGVRFGLPFIGSRALIGDLDDATLARRDADGISVAEAIAAFGLRFQELDSAVAHRRTLGYFEMHIEQGPVLESLGAPLGVVEAIAGQCRAVVTFDGRAGHAGTTPMSLRKDALAGAAEWIGAVEREAAATAGLVATVGRINAMPGASNVIAGSAELTLDVRHQEDSVRRSAVERLLTCAESVAGRRGLRVRSETSMDQAAVGMDAELKDALARAVVKSGHAVHRLVSGAGHDAMVMARRMPAAMLFLRSPGGISHHPDESVMEDDVAAALAAGLHFLDEMEKRA